MTRINRLTIQASEAQAVELDARGEKWAAHSIVALLAIIEDLGAAQTAPIITTHIDGDYITTVAHRTVESANRAHEYGPGVATYE